MSDTITQITQTMQAAIEAEAAMEAARELGRRALEAEAEAILAGNRPRAAAARMAAAMFAEAEAEAADVYEALKAALGVN